MLLKVVIGYRLRIVFVNRQHNVRVHIFDLKLRVHIFKKYIPYLVFHSSQYFPVHGNLRMINHKMTSTMKKVPNNYKSKFKPE